MLESKVMPSGSSTPMLEVSKLLTESSEFPNTPLDPGIDDVDLPVDPIHDVEEAVGGVVGDALGIGGAEARGIDEGHDVVAVAEASGAGVDLRSGSPSINSRRAEGTAGIY